MSECVSVCVCLFVCLFVCVRACVRACVCMSGSLSVGHYELCRDDIGDLLGSPNHL